MKNAIDITRQEIKWHEENRGKGPSTPLSESFLRSCWEEGFIRGLKHLLDLFQEADNRQ